MPYIKSEDRENLNKKGLMLATASNVGELNYQITMIIQDFLNTRERESYADYNFIIGLLATMENSVSGFMRKYPKGYLDLYEGLPYRIHRCIYNYKKLIPCSSIEIIGVLRCASNELYRRKIALYEDKKIQDNGDVYDTDM